MRVVRKNERIFSTFNDLKIEHLTSQGRLRMMSVEFPPGASMGELHAHEGEECHIVMEGKVLAEQGEDSIIVRKEIPLAGMQVFPILLKILEIKKQSF